MMKDELKHIRDQVVFSRQAIQAILAEYVEAKAAYLAAEQKMFSIACDAMLDERISEIDRMIANEEIKDLNLGDNATRQ